MPLRLEVARLPVVKLPPKYFREVIIEVSRRDGTRVSAIDASLSVLNRGRSREKRLDEKTGFRAMVSPTLTHLHVARSRPPHFYLAPNGAMIAKLERRDSIRAIGLILRDLLEIRLGLDLGRLREAYLKPTGRLLLDRPLTERLHRFMYYLEVYPPPHPLERGVVSGVRLGGSGSLMSIPEGEAIATELIRGMLSDREVIPIDTAREALQSGFIEKKGQAVSSFEVDALMNKLLESGDVCLPLTGGGSRIDTGQFRGPYLGLRRLPRR